MKYLRKFNESFNESEIHEICKEYNIKNYTINNGVVDVDGWVDLSYSKLTELPLKFGIVASYFYCFDNQLTTLEGCPKEVGGDFSCSSNKLTSLKGCPTYVGSSFYCWYNNLTSLKGGPTYVGRVFNCRDNELTNLEGSPREVTGDFSCSSNNLTSLEGFPNFTGSYFDCNDNPVFEIYRLFPDHQSFVDSLDYNYFRGGDKINKIRFTQALAEFGLKCPENIKGYIWE